MLLTILNIIKVSPHNNNNINNNNMLLRIINKCIFIFYITF